jgi:hypothetical protein
MRLVKTRELGAVAHPTRFAAILPLQSGLAAAPRFLLLFDEFGFSFASVNDWQSEPASGYGTNPEPTRALGCARSFATFELPWK